jgi:hypothetical protein
MCPAQTTGKHVMRPAHRTAKLASFSGRGPGTDAERRSARWLRSDLDQAGREAHLEPFWCRPNWALAHTWHVALALAGSLVSVSQPRIGGALILIALLSMIVDAITGVSLGRRLSPERASQNVVSPASGAVHGQAKPRVRLIVTANYDAGRTGLLYRPSLGRIATTLKRIPGGAFLPGWTGWLVILCAWLLITAILRLGGARGTAIGIAQLLPTVALVLALALLLELASSGYGPAAGDNGSGSAVAVALVRALDAAPPRNLAVELVLQGAGEGGGIGFRRHLRARRKDLRADNVVVLGIAACAAGKPRWWISDGPLIPLRFLKRLRDLAATVARAEAYLHAAPHRGRGATPALPARVAGLPAIAIGGLDGNGLVPRSHLASDTPEMLDPAAMDATLELALALVDAIDSEVARTAARSAPTPA